MFWKRKKPKRLTPHKTREEVLRDWKQFLVDRGDQPYSVTERTFYHWHNENAGQMELWEDMHRIYNDHIDEWRGVRALSPSQI